MKNKLLALTKGIIGLLFFYYIQVLWGILFSNQLKNGSNLTKNIILIGCEIVIAIVLVLMNYKKIKEDFKDFNTNYKKYLKTGIKYWLIGLIFMIITNVLVTLLTSNIAANEAANREIMYAYPLYSTIAMVLLAPFIEELTFRVNFKNVSNNKYIYIALTSLLFAGAHVLNGYTSPIDLLYLLPYGSLAIAFGATYYKTNNIYTTIVIHTMHNTLSLLLIILTTSLGV